MPTIIEGNIEALSKNGNNIFPITTPRAIIEEGSDRNLLDMLQDATRIPTAEEVGAASEEMISDAWSAFTTYVAGDYCIHNGFLWRCATANTGVEPGTNGTYWHEYRAAYKLSTLERQMANIPNFLTISVEGENFLRFKSSPYITSNSVRQHVFLFGSQGTQPIYGCMTIGYDYVNASFNNASITCSIEAATRIVSVSLPGNAWDTFELISVFELSGI